LPLVLSLASLPDFLSSTDGTDLRDKWPIHEPIGYPETYLGVMAPGYPNYFFVLETQGNARGGSVPLQTEVSATYIAKAIRKAQSQPCSSLDPREKAAQEFNDICAPLLRIVP
jgi:cation diffusion facilitator CzcD-associated flavoprotein CzcO